MIAVSGGPHRWMSATSGNKLPRSQVPVISLGEHRRRRHVRSRQRSARNQFDAAASRPSDPWEMVRDDHRLMGRRRDPCRPVQPRNASRDQSAVESVSRHPIPISARVLRQCGFRCSVRNCALSSQTRPRSKKARKHWHSSGRTSSHARTFTTSRES